MKGLSAVVGILWAVASGCASSDVPRPTELDATRVRTRWADASVDALAQGRRLYIGHCAGCHRPLAPASRTATEWRAAVNEMQAHASLDAAQVESVLRYLDAFARDPDAR